MEMFIGRPDDIPPCNLGDIVGRVYGIKLISPESSIDDLLDLYNDYKALYLQFGDTFYKSRMEEVKAMFKVKYKPA